MIPPTARPLRALYALLLSAGLCVLLFGTTTLHSQAFSATTLSTAATNSQRSPTDLLALQQQFARKDEKSHISKPVISPNGRFAAVTVVPLGTETANLARTELRDLHTGRVRTVLPGFTPRWLEGGAMLQLETMDRGLVTYLISDTLADKGIVALLPVTTEIDANRNTNLPDNTLGPVQLVPATYPTTIRVAHHPSNGCRDVADWQVDTIPFDEYVARVVPAETPAWWPIDALAAQAVAARSYAWRKILLGRADYDVTDWANFQMMCDDRYPNSDTAAAMTQGQYLTTVDDAAATPILAMYSAENGHPTLTNDSVSYLQSVPDRFALGQERWGHGYGLSQWGAYRRAKAGQTYRQILGHYYSHIYLRDATAPERPIGALLGDEPPYLLATDSIYLSAMHAPNAALRYEISASATLTEPVIIARASLSNTTLIWRAAQPLPAAAQITASLWISDALQDAITWTVDHSAPSAPLFAPPAVITTTAITLAIGAETGQPLVSAGWQWPGATLFHTANSGEVVSDSAAATGTAWHAAPGLHSAGVWYGPYTTALPAGHSYRALFWLRAAIGTEQTTGALPIARLDVTDDEGRVGLGLRDLHAADFADTLHYHPIAVDFHLFGAPKGLEFRVAWAGNTDLTLDRVEIWQLPDAMRTADSAAQQQMSATMNALFGWSLKSGAPTATANGFMQPIELRAMDAAGNLSASTAYSLTFVDQEPPQFAAVAEPQGWIRTRDFTLTAVVSDTGSGIDLGAGSVIVDGEDTAGNPISSTLPVLLRQQADTPTSATMRATLHDFPDGRYIAAFAAFDQVGNRAILPHPVRIDTVAPTVTVSTALPTDDNVNGPWSTTPLTINITAIDQGSGVQEIFYATPFAPNALRVATPYTAPLRLTQGGIYTFTAWAIDQAANQSAPITATYYLDLLPPTVQVTQTAINSTTVHVAWRADDDGSGIALVELQRRQEGEAWQPQPQHYIEPTATLAFAVSPTQQSYVRVRATDYVGRTGEWTELALWAPTDVVYLPLISAAK